MIHTVCFYGGSRDGHDIIVDTDLGPLLPVFDALPAGISAKRTPLNRAPTNEIVVERYELKELCRNGYHHRFLYAHTDSIPRFNEQYGR